MRVSLTALSVIVSLGLATDARAQAEPAAYPRAADVQSIDGIIHAFYDIVSGPAGEAPDRARDESVHFPGARIGMSRQRANGEAVFLTMDLAGYYERFGGVRDAPFHEWEIHRDMQQFGNIAHVWSTYVTSDRPGGAVTGRGINSIQLFYDGARWWITGWTDERERDGQPIPSQFLPAAR